MNPEYEKTNSSSSEATLVLLLVVLFVSLVIHIGLIYSVRDYAFAPLAPAVKTDRHWTKELPVMQVQKMAVDPLVRELSVEPRPAAAPVQEKREERVERLSPAGGGVAPEMPSTDVVLPAAEELQAKPADVVAAEWKPRQEILTIDNPVVPDEAAALPRLVIPKVERVKGASDIVPAFDLMGDAGKVTAPEYIGASLAGERVGGGVAIPQPAVLPPSVPSSVLAGSSPSLTVLSESEQRAVERAAVEEESARREGKTVAQKRAEAEARKKVLDSPAPPPLVVDEKVVEREKAAVRELRDEGTTPSRPFDQHVTRQLSAWIDPQQPDVRYFRIRVASRLEKPLPVTSKDIVFLLDASGSIANDRLKACRKAVGEALRRLNTGDRFNVIAFRDKFSYAFPETAWKEVTEKSLEAANDWMSKLTAHGQTDVFRVLRNVLAMPRDPTRPVVAFVATDGDATSGLTRSSEIIARFAELNEGLVSIYMYGVKGTANSYLMDMLTRASRGSWMKHDGYRWFAASKIPEFSARFERPVLSDISVLFSASSRAEIYPKLVSNLCEDEPVTIYGRCPAAQKDLVFQMRGLNGANVYESLFSLSFADAEPGDAALRAEWAQRRLFDMVSAYVRRPNTNHLREIRQFAEQHQLQVPYEKEMKK